MPTISCMQPVLRFFKMLCTMLRTKLSAVRPAESTNSQIASSSLCHRRRRARPPPLSPLARQVPSFGVVSPSPVVTGAPAASTFLNVGALTVAENTNCMIHLQSPSKNQSPWHASSAALAVPSDPVVLHESPSSLELPVVLPFDV